MIKADNLVKRYGNFELDISMEVQEGYITGYSFGDFLAG